MLGGVQCADVWKRVCPEGSKAASGEAESSDEFAVSTRLIPPARQVRGGLREMDQPMRTKHGEAHV